MRFSRDGLAARSCLGVLLGAAVGLLLASVAGYGQVLLTEIPLPSQILEPGANQAMSAGSPAGLGDGAVVFQFEVKDVDPLADDPSSVTITSIIIDNLGSATHNDLAEVMVLEGVNSVAGPAAPAAGPNPNISFRASFSSLSILIGDNQAKIFQIAVRTKGTSDLQNKAQNHTIQLQVTIQFTESIGSPPTPTSFLASITDSTLDFVFNGGINLLLALDFLPEPIQTTAPNNRGVVARFEICDQEANGHGLLVKTLILIQGPLGTALSADISNFQLFDVGSPTPLSSSGAPTLGFDRGGAGFSWTPVNVSINDDTCRKFEIKAEVSPTAMRGRTIHLRITFLVEEPAGTAIHASVVPALQMPQTVMIGSGVLRIPDMQISGIRSRVPIEVVGFPNVGLGRLEVQTGSLLFDPQVIRIEELVPEDPYQLQTGSVRIDNRAGRLNFTLFIDPAQSPSAKAGSDQPEAVAHLVISKTDRSQPGQRSILALQVDLIEDASGNDVTTQVVVISGSVILLTPGDVDLLDGIPTIRDALMLANAILPCLKDPPEPISGLSGEQKRVADVDLPQAPAGSVPGCEELTSADVAKIAELALTFEVTAVSLRSTRPSAQQSQAWWSTLFEGLLKLLRPSESASAKIELTLAPDPSRLVLRLDSQGWAVGGLQGRIHFNPHKLQIRSLRGLNEYELLATRIDNARGEARFVVLAPPGRGSYAQDVLEVALQASTFGDELSPIRVGRSHNLSPTSTPQVDLEFLLDPHGRSIPYTLTLSRAVSPLEVQFLRLTANGALWSLHVQGQGLASVRVEGFDLSGHKRFEAEAPGPRLQWMALDEGGRRLANGIYLYIVTVRGISGDLWQSAIHKMLVLR